MIHRRHSKKRPRLGNHGRLHHKHGLPNSTSQKGLFEQETLPEAICDFYKDGAITFTGEGNQLLLKIKKLPEGDLQALKKMRIAVKSQETQKQDICCLTASFLAGLICVVPWLFFRMQWFKKKYRPLYNTPIEDYNHLVQTVELCPTLEKLQISIQDNYIDAQKFLKIQSLITKSKGRLVIRNLTNSLDMFPGQQETIKSSLALLQGSKNFSFEWDKIKVSSQVSILSQTEQDQLL